MKLMDDEENTGEAMVAWLVRKRGYDYILGILEDSHMDTPGVPGLLKTVLGMVIECNCASDRTFGIVLRLVLEQIPNKGLCTGIAILACHPGLLANHFACVFELFANNALGKRFLVFGPYFKAMPTTDLHLVLEHPRVRYSR
jgi:hypothetical protein